VQSLRLVGYIPSFRRGGGVGGACRAESARDDRRRLLCNSKGRGHWQICRLFGSDKNKPWVVIPQRSHHVWLFSNGQWATACGGEEFYLPSHSFAVLFLSTKIKRLCSGTAEEDNAVLLSSSPSPSKQKESTSSSVSHLLSSKRPSPV
jgi:hypothetical protein